MASSDGITTPQGRPLNDDQNQGRKGKIANDEALGERKLLYTVIKLVPIEAKQPANLLHTQAKQIIEKLLCNQRGHSIITRTPERAIPAPIRSPISGKYPSNCLAQTKAKTIKKPP